MNWNKEITYQSMVTESKRLINKASWRNKERAMTLFEAGYTKKVLAGKRAINNFPLLAEWLFEYFQYIEPP